MAGDGRAATLALTHLGRVHVLRHEDDAAVECLDRAQRLAKDSGWLTFVPYPRAWRAEVSLRRGRVAEADELLVSAHTLALEVGDPCWESLAARGLGLVAAARGGDDAAARLLHDPAAA